MIQQAMNGGYVAGLMGWYVAKGVVAKKLIRDKNARLKFYTKTVSLKSRLTLKKLNFEVNVKGLNQQRMDAQNFLLVCNHMSYLDVLVMSSIVPSVFVTSVDMGESGFLGTLAELGGSIFVERRNRSQVERDLNNMTEVLKSGFNIVIYPEGTSTNGDTILPFKKSLLMSAVFAGKDILPVCIKYREINGKVFSPANRDHVCWYGDMDFMPHILNLFKTKKVVVDLEFLEPIQTNPDSTRDELASKAYEAITTAYQKK